MKNNIKVIFAFMLGVIISGGIVYATTTIGAEGVTYKNRLLTSTLDDLYRRADDAAIENTYYAINHSATRGSTNTVSLELGQGLYVCNAVYSGGTADPSSNSYGSTSGTLTANGCDSITSLNTDAKYQTASSKMLDQYLGVGNIQYSFACNLDSTKTISAVNTGYNAYPTHPLIMTLTCTKIHD